MPSVHGGPLQTNRGGEPSESRGGREACPVGGPERLRGHAAQDGRCKLKPQ